MLLRSFVFRQRLVDRHAEYRHHFTGHAGRTARGTALPFDFSDVARLLHQFTGGGDGRLFAVVDQPRGAFDAICVDRNTILPQHDQTVARLQHRQNIDGGLRLLPLGRLPFSRNAFGIIVFEQIQTQKASGRHFRRLHNLRSHIKSHEPFYLCFKLSASSL